MKTLLICHDGDSLNEIGLGRWLASFSDLVGIVSIDETNHRMWKRIRREINRVGILRFLDVLAFRLYYRLVHSNRDNQWEQQRLSRLCLTYPELDLPVVKLHTHSPNSSAAERFIRTMAPDIVIARCKTLLKEDVFSIATRGTFVMHPGICPEYRNAHGCFWALANGDHEHVGMTLLKVDKGVDTGAVYGYYSCDYDETTETHTVIQHRVVFDNLDALRRKLEQIYRNHAMPITVSGRASAAWGQPWLTQHLMWKRRARGRVTLKEAA